MYITPNTYIRILKGVHLDLDHTHTINFKSKSSQYNYFIGKTKYNLAEYSYQRHSKNSIKVQLKADDLYDCDYLMFQNSAYGNKMFYAFIINVEYINDSTSIIEYKIDVIQTWLLDMEYEPCFIERTHTRTDEIGDNIQPEPVALGEYKFGTDYFPLAGTDANTGVDKPISDMSVVILTSEDKIHPDSSSDGHQANGVLIDGIYSGYGVFVYDIPKNGDVKPLNDFVQKYVEAGKSEAILSMYMCPTVILRAHRSTKPDTDIPEVVQLLFSVESRTISKVLDPITGEESFDGYIPKNKKLYTYPYNFFHIDNASGEELSLRYEFFEKRAPHLHIVGTASMPVTVTLRPFKYKNVEGDYFTESLTLRNFPLCSWNVDSFQAWASQNAVPMILEGASSIASGSIAATIDPVVGGLSIARSIAGMLTQTYKASKTADLCRGSISTSNVNIARKTQQFYAGRVYVNKDNAESIDNYFTMFGYTVNKLDTPNRDNRTEYTYIKTIGCQLKGSFSERDKQEIVDIHDRGITYWNNPEHVGDYSVTNTPRG